MTDAATQTRTALCTGATGGIGRTTAVFLAEAGLRVLIHGRDQGRDQGQGREVVGRIRGAGGRADVAAAELRDAASARALAAEAPAVAGGRTDALVNDAGVGAASPSDAAVEKEFDRIYGVDAKAPYFLTAALVPGMAER